jgi:hypothetical protein
VSGMMEGHSRPTTGFGWHTHRRDRDKSPQVEGVLCLHVILSDRLLGRGICPRTCPNRRLAMHLSVGAPSGIRTNTAPRAATT